MIERAAPLPECLACETPTKRATHDRTGGFCSLCDPNRPFSQRTTTPRESTR